MGAKAALGERGFRSMESWYDFPVSRLLGRSQCLGSAFAPSLPNPSSVREEGLIATDGSAWWSLNQYPHPLAGEKAVEQGSTENFGISIRTRRRRSGRRLGRTSGSVLPKRFGHGYRRRCGDLEQPRHPGYPYGLRGYPPGQPNRGTRVSFGDIGGDALIGVRPEDDQAGPEWEISGYLLLGLIKFLP